MAIFSRRRIQSMIDDLSPYLNHSKRKDLVNRLNDKRVEQALPAEMELSLIWMLRELDLEIEPEWWADGKNPDAYVEGLIQSIPAVIEITAIADNTMSGEPQMDFCATKLMEVASNYKRGIGDYLYFTFAETREYNRGRSERGIAAPKNYSPSDAAKQKIQQWIDNNPGKGDYLKLEDGQLFAHIERREYKQIRYHNFHVSRPPRVYSDTSNPIYKTLSKKASQVANAPDGTWRIIFLAEAGSQLLSNVTKPQNHYIGERYSTGRDIINKFIEDKSGKVDAVVVFIPDKQFKPEIFTGGRYDQRWAAVVFGDDNPTNRELFNSLETLMKQLPEPNFNGYNARSLTRQGAMLHTSKGRYVGTSMTSKDNEITFRMSSRALQDFLAGRIDEQQFRQFIGERDDGPSIGRFLDFGYTIQNIRYESSGIDTDDDYVIFDFAKDAAASPFK